MSGKKKQHEKELNSLRNKMGSGSNLVWFDSLSIKKKYDLLFMWKFEKYRLKDINSTQRFTRRGSRGKISHIVIYPINFKYWITSRRSSDRFRVETKHIRNSAIDIILNQKISKKL